MIDVESSGFHTVPLPRFSRTPATAIPAVYRRIPGGILAQSPVPRSRESIEVVASARQCDVEKSCLSRRVVIAPAIRRRARIQDQDAVKLQAFGPMDRRYREPVWRLGSQLVRKATFCDCMMQR